MGIVTADELKSFLGIGDTVDDPTLTIATNAANQWVTEYCGRTFDTTATGAASARLFRPTDTRCAAVDDFYETTVLVVKVDQGDDGTYEQTWVLNTDFYLEPINGQVAGQVRAYNRIVTLAGRTFPTNTVRPPVQVTAAWGWAATPAAVKLSTLIQAARLFKRKDSAEGVLGGFADFTALRVSSRLDPDVEMSLQPFRHPDIAVKVR